MSDRNKVKRLLSLIIIVILLVIVISVILKVQRGKGEIQKIMTLPQFSFNSLDNRLFTTDSLQQGKYTIIMLYSTDCIHCLTTFDQVADLISDNDLIQVIMVSPDSLEIIQKFKDKFDLDISMSIKFLQCNEMKLYKVFGRFNYPTLFLYDCNNKLIDRLTENITMDRLKKIINESK